MPEVSDPTPSEHDRVKTERCSENEVLRNVEGKNRRRELRSVISEKRIRPEKVVLSRGRELPKAGPVTGVKS